MTVRFKGDGLMLKPFKFAPSFDDFGKGLNPAPKPPAPAKPSEPTKPVEPPPTTPTPK